MKKYIIIFICFLSIFTQSSVFAKTKKKKEFDLIPLKVEKVEKNIVTAKIKETTKKGKSLGLDNLILKGILVEEKISKKRKKVTITWNKASLGGEEKELENPLSSKIMVKNKIEKDDVFNAKGKSSDLVDVWDKLNNDLKNKKHYSLNGENLSEEEKKKFVSSSDRSSAGGSSVGGSSSKSTTPTITGVTPDYSTEDIITTAEGCEVRIDETLGMAIVQTKQIQGDDELSDCADSATTYSLERNYEECTDYIDYQTNRAYKQYTLGYNNPDVGGRIQIYGCTINKEQYAEIIEDTSACSIRNDFKTNESIQQSRILYEDENGGIILLQNCSDTETKYLHQSTFDGCSDEVADSSVILNSRKFITVNNKVQYITECLPQDGAITIHEETCQDNEYEHDFLTNQSYQMKTFFYYKNNQRINIKECIKSEDSLIHKYDTNDCKVVNDDTGLKTQYFAKTYIEDAGGKVFIKDCEESGVPIPYVQKTKKWIKNNTVNGHFAIASPNFRAGTHYLGGSANPNWSNISRDFKQCYTYNNNDIWTVGADGRDINEKNSDQFMQYVGKTWNSYHHHGYHAYLGCTDPHCTAITTLSKYLVYTRGDSSEYLATNQPLEKMYVCGTGSKIENKEE